MSDDPLPPAVPVQSHAEFNRVRPANLLAIASTCAVVLCSSYLTFSMYAFTGESFGFWIGSMLGPFLIAYLAGGVKRWRNPIAYSVCLLLLGVALPIATHRTTPTFSYKSMLRQVADTEPLSRNLGKNDVMLANSLRPVFAEMRDNRASYYAKYDALKPDLQSVCTPKSFANGASMQKTRDAVLARLVLDRGVSDWLNQFPVLVEVRLAHSGLSPELQRSYLDNFKSGFASSDLLDARREMMAAEESWAKVTIDLYSYSILHQGNIHLMGGKVAVSGHLLLTAFNTKLSASEDLQKKFAAKVHNFEIARQSDFKKAGVTLTDLGIGPQG